MLGYLVGDTPHRAIEAAVELRHTAEKEQARYLGKFYGPGGGRPAKIGRAVILQSLDECIAAKRPDPVQDTVKLVGCTADYVRKVRRERKPQTGGDATNPPLSGSK
jgi:hypothetical protein